MRLDQPRRAPLLLKNNDVLAIRYEGSRDGPGICEMLSVSEIRERGRIGRSGRRYFVKNSVEKFLAVAAPI